MIITRTPYRVSFFGGGTDYPQWFTQHGGAVLTSTLNKYCYVSVRYMPPFLGSKYIVFWSKMEKVDRIEDIQHPAVRACLQYAGIDQGFEINHAGDLPARSGLGSSSAFTVGLIHALYALQGHAVIFSKSAIAASAVHLEQTVMKETVGLQDQIECAHGGLNVIRFNTEGQWTVEPLRIPMNRMLDLESRLMLFYTGLQRYASEIATDQIANIPNHTKKMLAIRMLVEEAQSVLMSGDLSDFGRLLDYGWALKRGLSARISSDTIDDMYEAATSAGALGGKILGAGGGGFMLLYVEPERQAAVRKALSKLLEIPFKFENSGTQLVLCDR